MPVFSPLLSGSLPSLRSPVRGKKSVRRNPKKKVAKKVARKRKAAKKKPASSYLTVAAAAKKMRVTPATIRKYIRDGLLRGYRDGEKIKIREADLMPPRKKAAKKAKKKVAKKKAKKKNAKRTPLKGGTRGKRGGTKKAAGKFEHLRARSPSSFQKGSLKTIPWMFAHIDDRTKVRKLLGLRSVPSGTKVVSGKFKTSSTTLRVPGKRVKYLANGIQSVLIPIKGGKKAKSPAGTKRKTKKAAKKIVRRATRKNAAPKRASRSKYAKIVVKVYGPTKAGGIRKNPQGAAERRKHLKSEVERFGPNKVYDAIARLQRDLAASGMTGAARLVQLDLNWLASTYQLGPTGTVDRMPYSRRNPATKAPKLPKAILSTLKAATPAERKKLTKVLATFTAAELKEAAAAAAISKKFHGRWPRELVPVGTVGGRQKRIRAGLGKADHVGYHTNSKKHRGSTKDGTPWRHKFENGQELMATADGKRLAIVNSPKRKRGTKIKKWIRG